MLTTRRRHSPARRDERIESTGTDTRRPLPAVGVRDIAQRLGVSIGTVDRALHDKAGIKPETRIRVLAAAESLGYSPNLAARYLRSRRQQRIVAHLPEGDSWFVQTLRDGMREGAAPFAPSLVLDFRSYASADEQARLLRPGALRGSAGLIVLAGVSEAIAARLEEVSRHHVPVASIVDAVPDSPRVLSVCTDAFSVGALAGELMGRFLPGRGEVAIVGPSLDTRAHAEQVRGFGTSLSMLSARIKVAGVVDSHADERETQRRVRDLLHAHPRLKGVYISASQALPVLRSAGHEGRLADLTVIATDLSPELLPWIRSGKVAATIYQRPLTQGQMAVRLLQRYLQTRVLSTPLRQIVAPYAVMNSNLNIVLQRLDIARTAALACERAEARGVVSA